MTNQKVKRGAASLMDLTYSYARGNSKGTLNGTTGQLTKIVDNKDRNKDRVYEFDTLGRLITAKGGLAAGAAAPATASWTQGYTYDRYGNKLTTTSTGYTAGNQTIPLDGLASQSFAATTNRITTAGYSYDKAGNVIRGKSPTGSWQKYEYDTAGRLRYVMDDTGWIQQANEYASSRQRLSSWSYASVDITYYAWGGSSVLAEYTTQSSSSSLTWQKSYVYAGSRLLSTITNTAGNEVTEYHHPDRLGTRLISNPVTATQSEQLTLPFGTLIGAETSATNDKRFTSYDRSEIAGGLDYAVNRNYNSGQSRFTQVDPIGMASASIGNPQSLNLFAYVQNNPVDFVDPSGLNMSSNFVCYDMTTWGHYSNDPDTMHIRTTTVCHFFGGGGSGGGSIGGGGDDIPRGGRIGGRNGNSGNRQDDDIDEGKLNYCLDVLYGLKARVFNLPEKDNKTNEYRAGRIFLSNNNFNVDTEEQRLLVAAAGDAYYNARYSGQINVGVDLIFASGTAPDSLANIFNRSGRDNIFGSATINLNVRKFERSSSNIEGTLTALATALNELGNQSTSKRTPSSLWDCYRDTGN